MRFFLRGLFFVCIPFVLFAVSAFLAFASSLSMAQSVHNLPATTLSVGSIQATDPPTSTESLTSTDSLTSTEDISTTLSSTTTDSLPRTAVIAISIQPTETVEIAQALELTTTTELTATQELSSTESVSETTEVVEPAIGEAEDGAYVAIEGDVDVHSGPSDVFDVVDQIASGTVVEILEIAPDSHWYRVSLEDGENWGWIAASLAQVTEPPATAVAPPEIAIEPSIPTAVTQPENMNVRAGPGTNYPVVAVVPNGTQLEILALNPEATWYQVDLDDQDEPAWVYASLTEGLGLLEQVERLSEDEIPPAPEPVVAAAPTGPAVSAPPPSGAGFFGYGLQAHMLGGGIDQAMNATSHLGFNWMKQQVQWRDFEGNPGHLDFSELRRIVDAASARGISVLFSVVNAPDWAREPGFDSSVGGPPADPGTLANFVGRLAGDFCGSGLKAIEVWNEQNLHYEWGNKPLNPAEYMNLLRVSYASIKRACPSMLVISGALTPAGDAGAIAMDDFTYLERMYQNGLRNYADGIGAHPSGYNVPPSVGWQSACAVIQRTGNNFNGACDNPHHSWSFRSTMEGYRNIMVVYGDTNKRIWPTEFGWAAGGAFNPHYAYANDNTFEEQRNWTVEAFQMMRNWGWVGPAFLWNLNFRVVADGTEKAQWGIVRNDYSPLPIYEGLRAMPK